MQFLLSYEEAKQFECGCIDAVVQKDSISLSIIVVFEWWELTHFSRSLCQWRMHVNARFFAQNLVIFLNRSFGKHKRLELICKSGKKSIDFINTLLRELPIFPEEPRLQDGHDLCIGIHLPFFYSTFFFISYNYYRRQRSIKQPIKPLKEEERE